MPALGEKGDVVPKIAGRQRKKKSQREFINANSKTSRRKERRGTMKERAQQTAAAVGNKEIQVKKKTHKNNYDQTTNKRRKPSNY